MCNLQPPTDIHFFTGRVKVVNCYNVLFGTRSRHCNFSAFIEDCIGCTKCIACVGLRNENCCIFNKKVSEDDFQSYWRTIFDGTRSSLENFKQRYTEFLLTTPKREEYILNCQDSTGEDLESCDNVKKCINCLEAQNLRYCLECYFNASDSYDVNNWGEQMEFCYELSGCGGVKGGANLSHCMFSSYIFYGGHEIFYSVHCVDVCQHLFGCADLVKKNYCILNKQYTAEEYFALLPRIIEHMQTTGEWGEFFPLKYSAFGYNESLASEYFPFSKEQALALQANWNDDHTIAAEKETGLEAPDALSDFTEKDLKSAFLCQRSKKPYRIIGPELEYYRKHNLPLPNKCFYQRHLARHQRLYGDKVLFAEF